MRLKRLHCVLLVFASAALVHGNEVEDYRIAIRTALDEWRRASHNVQLDCVTELYNVEYDQEVTQRKIVDLATYDCKLLRIDNSYRSTIAWTINNSGPPRLLQTVQCHRNAKAGVVRLHSTDTQTPGEQFGVIRLEEDGFTKVNRANFWFDGSYLGAEEFFVTYLLSQLDRAKIEVRDGGMVLVTDISERSGVTCECKWVLSEQWGFLPSKFLRHLSKDQEAFFHDRTLEVNEMIRVDEVWFPKKFTEWEYNNTSAKAGYVNMYDSTVSNVEFGSLKQQDLELVFPRGTIVHDQIIGAWRGLPIGMKALD